MKDRQLRSLFSLLTNAARYLTAYPLFLFCFTGILKKHSPAVALYTAAVMVFAFLSMVLSRFVRKHVERSIWLRIVQGVMILLSALFGVVLCRIIDGNTWMCMYTGIIFALYSIIGSISETVKLQRWEFFISSGLYIFVVGVLCIVRKTTYPVNAFIIQFLLIAAVFAIEYNFLHIDFLMQRRGHEMSHLPSKIRGFNLTLLFGGLVFLVVMVLFRKVFLGAAGAFLKAFGGVLYFLLTPLRNWWNSDAPNGRPIDMPEPDWEADPDNAFELLVQDDLEPTVNVDLQVDLLIFVGVIVLIIGIYLLRKPLKEALSIFWEFLTNLIRRLFSGFSLRKAEEDDDSIYYVDEEERLDGAGVVESATATELRGWRKRLRAYQKMEPSREKYLTGFSLSVQGLQLHGVPVRPSDTPLEVLQKAEQILDPQGYRVAVESCNALAFSSHEPAPAWQELTSALDTLRNRKSHK